METEEVGRRLKLLAGRPAIEVMGLVESCPRGLKEPGAWYLELPLEAWRRPGEPLQERRLVLWRTVADEELGALIERFKPEAIAWLRVKLGDVDATGRQEGVLDGILQVGTHDELLADIVKRRQIPVVFTDEELGTFTWDRSLGWYDGRAVWDGASVELALAAKVEDEREPVLNVARALWSNQVLWSERVQAFAVQALLPILNGGWLEQDEEPLTGGAFVERMRLESVTVYPDGAFCFWFDDGDLFGGHAIAVSGNLDDGPTDADTPG